MGNQQGGSMHNPTSHASHSSRQQHSYVQQPVVVVHSPAGARVDERHSDHSSGAKGSLNNFLGIPLPNRTRRHSDASAGRLDSSSPDFIQEGKNKLLQLPGGSSSHNRQRRKSVDNSVISIPASSGALHKFPRPTMDSIFNIGKRSRRSSMIDQEPIQIKTPDEHREIFDVPIHERYFETMDESEMSTKGETEVVDEPWSKFLNPNQNQRKRRTRAVSMVEHNHAFNEDERAVSPIPTVFKFSIDLPRGNVQRVHVTGNMTNWNCVEMCKPKGESDYFTIIGCRPGNVIFKFLVDGEWTYNKDEEIITQNNNSWNILHVQASDIDVFNALDCDSMVLKDKRKKQPSDEDREDADVWGQEKPSEEVLMAHKNKGPPILPPHLLQILLNKDHIPNQTDPVLLPEPSYVSLNHLYAQSIRDNMLVLSTTHRYRKKCVTLLFYKPI